MAYYTVMNEQQPPEDDDGFALFRETVGAVEPVKTDAVVHHTPKPKPRPRRERPFADMVDDQPDWSDQAIEMLEHGESVSFARPGVQHKVLRKLKRGGFSVSASLDLHGMTIEQARLATSEFLREERRELKCCVRIVHGKGYRSKDGQPLLKNMLNRWLPQREDVIAFCSAPPHDGGTGAMYVLLKRR